METILNLRKFVMPEVVFGKGARKLAGQYAEKFSLKKVLLVTDKGIIENNRTKYILFGNFQKWYIM